MVASASLDIAVKLRSRQPERAKRSGNHWAGSKKGHLCDSLRLNGTRTARLSAGTKDSGPGLWAKS